MSGANNATNVRYKKKTAYFCVAHPDFETSRKVDNNVVEYDREFVSELLQDVATFWKKHIYQLLLRSVKC